MARLIGTFKAKQQRERLLRRNNYSHLIAVFDECLLMIETRPELDAAVAAINFVPAVGHIPGIGHSVMLGKHLYGLVPVGGRAEEIVSGIPDTTPDALITKFPNHVRRLNTEQIASAVLRQMPPELRLKYRDGSGPHQLWLKLPLTESVEPVYEMMRQLLGPRLSRTSFAGGLLDGALDMLPG